jgi:hypothetical protein
METPALEGELQRAWEALRPAVRAWRTGAADQLLLRDALESWSVPTRRAVEAAHRGDVEVPASCRETAHRLHAWAQHFSLVEDVCGRWANATAHWDGRALSSMESLGVALTDGQPYRAVAAWKAGREPLLDLDDDVARATRAFHGVVPGPSASQAAAAFLKETRDLYEDARDHAFRRHATVKDGPQTLQDARVVESSWMADVVPTAASRHVARDVVAGLPKVQAALRRLMVKPLPFLPGFPDVTPAGAPHVGWVERRGVAGMLELVDLTVRASGLSLQADDGSARVLGLLSQLGLVTQPVVRQALRMERGDADAVRRHAAFVMLRQARLAAALCADNPSTPEESRDGVVGATLRDPDVLLVSAWMGPFPEPTPTPGMTGGEHALRFQLWAWAASAASACLQQLDDDFVLRPAFHALWADALQGGGVSGPATLAKALGARDDDVTSLRDWFLQALG